MIGRTTVSTPFISEIKIMSFGFPPKGWALCDGQFLPINQNQALFSLLGTTYGGDGRSTFALPNLQGRVPMHMGNGFTLGQVGGEQSHTLSIAELPTHTHNVRASSSGTGGQTDPAAKFLGGGNNVYHSATNLTPIAAATLSSVGGSQPHLNMQPFLTLSFCIALLGIFPSQN
jgi:microcystin-dependent protein